MRHFNTGTAIGLFLALAGCGGDGYDGPPAIAAPSPTPSPTPSPSPTATPTGDIARNARVAFIGSSVINGVGAGSRATSWTTLISQYLDTRFQTVDSRVLAANRTDAEFGAYRIDSDLARENFVPDLAFISFTNDTTDPLAIRTFQDAIIFKLRQRNPNVVVVLVAVTRTEDEAERRAGVVPPRVAATRDLAAAEGAGVVFVDAGAAIWNRVITGGQPVGNFFANGFPNDAGYKEYADAVIAALAPGLSTLSGANTTTSAFIASTGLQNARLVETSAATANGCAAYTDSPDQYLLRAIACTSGQGFSLAFSGATLGITRATIGDGGNLSCSVDGGTPVVIDFFERGLNMAALRPVRVFEGLPDVAHQATCTVLPTSPSGSNGSRVIIGSFFVSSGRVLTG